MVDVERLKGEFRARYGGECRVFSAPGRVNLIGEHTDYNDGFVLPMAIERRTWVAAADNGSSHLRVASLNQPQAGDIDLAAPAVKRRGCWLDYVEGTARSLAARGFAVSGADLLVSSDVPAGAGLSASAALELSLGLALASLSGATEPDHVQLALAGQAAEHEYVGTLCGIMDQYIAALAQEGTALLVDCRSLATRAVPMRSSGVSVLVCDTRVKHQLASSEYNQRRAECMRGVSLLAKAIPGVRALRDVSLADFERWSELLPGTVRNRCRHVVTENARTLAAAEALSAGDLVEVGRLMVASHASLRDDFQVSCQELDVAVQAATAEPGVYGSRMTGGGFGGCTVSLAESAAIERVTAAVQRAFAERGLSQPELFATRACGGARVE